MRLQRAWRRHSSIIAAQLGVFSLQFDALLRTRDTSMLREELESAKWVQKTLATRRVRRSFPEVEE